MEIKKIKFQETLYHALRNIMQLAKVLKLGYPIFQNRPISNEMAVLKSTINFKNDGENKHIMHRSYLNFNKKYKGENMINVILIEIF